ncbi:MAG: hypothetical protein PSU94_17390 [Lacunisphaera sp.]|nr:hypothetical protein [Lacunisphaera sp.]
MKKHPASLICSIVAALLLAACDSDQGPSPAINQPATAMGDRKHELAPAPESKSYAGKKDVFQGAEYDPGAAGALPAGARQVQMRLGQVLEVYRGNFAPGEGKRELSFYLPMEARGVVQLVVEKNGFARTYFLKAVGIGDTVGGVVEHRWLDSDGYNPKDTASEARIQAAVKASPYLISVTN